MGTVLFGIHSTDAVGRLSMTENAALCVATMQCVFVDSLLGGALAAQSVISISKMHIGTVTVKEERDGH